MNSHAAQRFASLEDLLPSTCQPLAVSQKVPALPQRLDTNCCIYETAESKGFQSHPKVHHFFGDFTILEFFDFLDLLVANFLSKDVSICGFLEANLTPLETSEYLNFNRDLENRKN